MEKAESLSSHRAINVSNKHEKARKMMKSTKMFCKLEKNAYLCRRYEEVYFIRLGAEAPVAQQG